MKICFMGDAQSIHLQRWANYFIKNGHVVHIITMEPNEIKGAKIHNISFLNLKKEIPNIKFVGYLIHKYREYKSILVLKSLLDKIKPDILNSHYMTIYGIMGSMLNLHPYVITCWGSDVLIVPNILGKKYVKKMKKASRKADLIIVVSEYMKKKLIKMEVKKNIIVNPFGIDFSQFNPNGKEIRAIKEKFGNKIVIISTRNLKPIYNIECLIKSFSSVLEKEDNVIFLICGSGSLENKLRKLVNNLDLSEYVHFLGKISHKEMPDYLRSADIYVSASLSDGISISLLEAMGCGLIPVVSDIPGNNEVIKDGKNGFIFKNNPVDLSKKLNYCIKNYDNLRENIIKPNLKKIEEKYNWNKHMNRLLKSYEKLINGKKIFNQS